MDARKVMQLFSYYNKFIYDDFGFQAQPPYRLPKEIVQTKCHFLILYHYALGDVYTRWASAFTFYPSETIEDAKKKKVEYIERRNALIKWWDSEMSVPWSFEWKWPISRARYNCIIHDAKLDQDTLYKRSLGSDKPKDATFFEKQKKKSYVVDELSFAQKLELAYGPTRPAEATFFTDFFYWSSNSPSSSSK